MPNPWFRLYSEFADDPKVQTMSHADQRHLIILFCLRCKGQLLETFRDREIAYALGLGTLEAAKIKETFLEMGFIDERWNIVNWNRRQYISDSSTERVRKYRLGLKHDETLPKRHETPTVTVPEADTEAEQKQQEPYPTTPKSGVLDDKEEAKQLKAEERAAEKQAKALARAAAKEELKKLLAAKKKADKKASPPTKTEYVKTRHAEFKVAIFEYWKSKNKEIDCPWDQQEGMQLELWLKSSPNTTITQFKEMLRNRYRSETVHSERPSVWIKNITSYALGPLNTYRQPLNGGGKPNGKSADRAFATATQLIHEIEDRDGSHAGELLSGSGAN